MLDQTIMVVDEVSGDEPALAAALSAADLPVDDLTAPGRRFFRFWIPGGEPIGFIGAEDCGEGGVLLRSLVVLPGQRRRGWSPAMVGWLLEKLAAAGIAEAWLLTISAVPLAERLGFQPVSRDSAPAAMRATPQFTSLCPASAALMHRSIP
jgi:arsenate reductase/amino-acid N-acetyltransferase